MAMATSVPLPLLASPFWNRAFHVSVGHFCKHGASAVYHVLKGYELKRRTQGLWQRRRNGEKAGHMQARAVGVGGILAVDPWAPNVDSQSIASLLFAASLFPYLGFLYHITKSQSAPKLTLFGFYFLLAFVGATSQFGQHAPSYVVYIWKQICEMSMCPNSKPEVKAYSWVACIHISLGGGFLLGRMHARLVSGAASGAGQESVAVHHGQKCSSDQCTLAMNQPA